MLIDTPAAFAEALDFFASSPWLAVDTEFVREETYWPQLCLVQVGDRRRQVAFDAIKLADLRPLLNLLQRADSIKVFHAASQDLEIFVHLGGKAPTPLFDTQIAASLLGLGDQLGYAGLVEKRLGLKVDKSLSRTNWSRRPLTEAELAYAEDDVRHLSELYPALREELIARGRLQWLEEDCARLARPERYQVHPETAWDRLKGLGRLPAPSQHVAAALASWREKVAEARDRPRKWILADDALYRLAERQPDSVSQLTDLQVLPPRVIERQGSTLLQVIAESRGSKSPALATDGLLSDAQKSVIQKLANRSREIATELGIPPSLLAPRADIEAVALRGAAAKVPVLEGWRRQVAGDVLLQLLPA